MDAEIDLLRRMGVEFRTNFVVGRTRKLLDLMDKDGFDAIFIGSGAGLPVFTGMPGEDLVGVFSANEYLTRANMMGGIHPGRSDTPMFVSRRPWSWAAATWPWLMPPWRVAWCRGSNRLYRRSRPRCRRGPRRSNTPWRERIEIRFLENALEVRGWSGRVRAVTVSAMPR